MSHAFWTPEPLFSGATVFVLGGGPSLRGFDVERLRGRHVIAVNSSFRLAPWAEVIYFTDNSWFERFRAEIEPLPGLLVTVSSHAKLAAPDRVRRLDASLMGAFPRPGDDRVRCGKSSGQTALSLAIAMAAARIVLLGFDMRAAADGRTHHHDDYRCDDPAQAYGRDFGPAFRGWRDEAAAAGVAVLNATPDSALTEFPMIAVEEALDLP